MNNEQQRLIEEHLFRMAYCQELSTTEKRHLMTALLEEPASTPAFLADKSGLKHGSKETFLRHCVTFDADKERDKLNDWGISWISRISEEFPSSLKNIYDSPLGLFCMGDCTLLKKKTLSVVGARSCTPYGRECLKRLLPDVIREGFVIVSGLARGIDTVAHETAIQEGGKTIAVIGTGIDFAYPAENRELQRKIATQHLLLSEYPLGTKPMKEHFPMRNRIISGLSMGTLVVEARRRSGSLITANLALNEGREVFAVPGSILSPLSEGTNELIKHGAKCVYSSKDILEESMMHL